MEESGPLQLAQRDKEWSILLDVASRITEHTGLPQVLGTLVNSLAEAFDLNVCFTALVNPEMDRATVAASYLINRSPRLVIKDTPVQLSDFPLAQAVITRGTPIQIFNPDDPLLTDIDRKNMIQDGCTSALVVPVKTTDVGVIAIISLSWEKEKQITPDEVRLVQVLARYIGLAIKHAHLYEQDMKNREWLQILVDAVPGGIYSLDSERRIQWANRTAKNMIGATSSTIPVGAHCYDFVDIRDENGESICQKRCPVLECFLHHKPVHTLNAYLTQPGGRKLPVSISDIFVVLPSGEERVIGLVTDLSYQKAAEEFRDSLVSIVSHEFRTPLHHIKGFTTSLLRTDVNWDMDTQKEFLEGIDQEADRLAILVSNLLDLSRLEAGHELYSERTLCEPGLLAKKALERSAPFTLQHPVTIHLPQHSKPLSADPDELERVLVNLLENAAKFSCPGQPIILVVKNRKDGVEFHVRDRGRGIPKDEQSKLFEKFSRVRAVAGIRGVGLGLAICKAFVERHGGKIWLERSTPGRGSDFAFWIPFNVPQRKPKD